MWFLQRVAVQKNSVRMPVHGMLAGSVNKSTRGFATEEQLKKRMKSIGNIKKITAAMKMVASARLRRSQAKLDASRLFVTPIEECWPEVDEPAIEEAMKEHTAGRNYKLLYAGIACDRGLCGGMNSSITRDLKKKLEAKEDAGEPVSLITFGEKGRSALERLYGKYFEFAIGESGKNIELNFKQTCEITDRMLALEADEVQVVANKFRNMITFDTLTHKYFDVDVFSAAHPKAFEEYEMEGPDGETMRNFNDFRLACIFWGHFAETDTVELSARVTAMENSSKNAGEMLEKITLKYNTMRQAKITTELIEIISGATALEDA